MTVYGVWYGGVNYGPLYVSDDVEEFENLNEAKAAFRFRRDSGGYWKSDFRYVNRDKESVFTPNVDETSEMHLYFSDPTNRRDPYPDCLLKFGPRGGAVFERC